MRDSIFHTNVEMPLKSNDPGVVRSAMTPGEMRRNLTPASVPDDTKGVKSVERPRRGHDY
jgi:hypothetical protein